MISYKCDKCGVSIDALHDALIISVSFLHYDPTASAFVAPIGRLLDVTRPDLLFHDVACRDAWCAQAGILSLGAA